MTKTLLARTLVAAGLAALIATAAACDNGGSSSPAGPTVPAVTNMFSGTLPNNQADFFQFTTTQPGEVDVTLVAEGPSSLPSGAALGTMSADGSTCTPQLNLAGTVQLGLSPALTPVTTAAAGVFCVFIIDQFQLGPITYTFNVTHH